MEVLLLSDPLVEATIDLQRQVTNKFMPSAVKFVYNWNMRELSNVFQGITVSKASVINTN